MKKNNIYITDLQNIIQIQKKLISTQQRQINGYEKLIKLYKEKSEEKKQKLINTQWVAMYEFITLFMGTKGKIYDNKYLRSAFSLAGLPLTEKNVINIFEYAIKHFEHDYECMKNEGGDNG